MAAPLLDPLLAKMQQTKLTAARAAGVLRAAFPAERATENNIAVQLPRRDVPTYVLPNNKAQPWELLPMKAAAMAEYPNFFNNSCTFFGSMKRDIVNGLPFCLLRPSRLAIDLSKVVRNLGIVDGFEVVQRRRKLGQHDFVWTSDQPEPDHIYDVALFKQRLIRLHLRTDLYSLNATSGSCAATPLPPSAQLAPAFGLLPLSVKNVSKASQPVLMYPRQLEQARERLPAGVFVCYHHELGLITDAVAELYDVPALVAAHVGLPLSQVVQIRGALRLKAKEEAGRPLRQVTPLKSWNMVEAVRRRMVDRLAVAEQPAEVEAEAAAEAVEGSLQARMQELRDAARQEQQQANKQLSAALSSAQELEDGLLAWRVLRSGVLRQGGAGAAGEQQQQQPQRQQEGEQRRRWR
ncbi:hypothetical protein Agub_g16032 [Astrephomene gubernaculifera]|uniref:Uncharacterized protein n=1 Tax=Astrephomene gubernaculifera TaxID=47775 RepID=A0AAD3HUL8_9CHLO|nr:hypothetical protein Agub_g16032 [Astrephomene gubernaculifera]